MYGYEPHKVSHHCATFGGLKHGSSSDIMVLVCHVILKNRMIKLTSDIMPEISS